MPAERERTFLVAEMPSLKGVKSADIVQYYISKTPGGLRLRLIGDRAELTQKLPLKHGDRKDRDERDPLFPNEDDVRKLKSIADRHLKKRRHYIPLPGGLTAELDVYQGKLRGHRSIDVEFPSAAAKKSFVPPPWFGPEITEAKLGSNAFLAGKSYKDIEPLIDEIGAARK